MDVVTSEFEDKVLWHMLLADVILLANDIVTVEEIKDGLSRKLDNWKDVLERKDLKIICIKTKYLICNFNPKIIR